MEVKLHDIGEGMTEAVVLTYLVQKGDYVKADQPLVEVQTDKMVAEIPAPAEGIVQDILVREGETIAVGTTILTLQTSATVKPNPASSSNAAESFRLPSVNEKTGGSVLTKNIRRVLATPYTRKIAREHGVDLEQIAGTGPGGRITDEDVYRFIEAKQTKRASSAAALEAAPKKKIRPRPPHRSFRSADAANKSRKKWRSRYIRFRIAPILKKSMSRSSFVSAKS